jgi:hypothetical protein
VELQTFQFTTAQAESCGYQGKMRNKPAEGTFD